MTIATLTPSGWRRSPSPPRGIGVGHRMFTGCWITGHRLSALRFPFTASGPVATDAVTLAARPAVL